MQNGTQIAAGNTGKMRPETLKCLETLLYASGRCTDGARIARFASTFLGRRLTHSSIVLISEDEAQRLIESFDAEFPDPQAGIAARIIKEVLNRT